MINEATMWDALDALAMGEEYVKEAGEYVGLGYDPELAVGNMQAAILDPRQLFLISRDSSGEAVGMLWCMCAPLLPWSSESIALDQIVYVKPSHRGSRHGLLLLRAYFEWAESLGAVEIRLSIASGVQSEKTGKLYQKLGFSELGKQYRRKTNGNEYTRTA